APQPRTRPGDRSATLDLRAVGHLDARPQLVTGVAAHGVRAAAVKALVGRDEMDTLARERDAPRRHDGARQRAPREHPAPAEPRVRGDLELAPVELVQRV